MIELERHIEILLLKNDCVIVPGLGGFTANHVPARFDEDDNTFIPPLRTLGFNPKLNINDSLLAQSYTEAYDISYPEALRRIADETNELKQCLNNNGYFSLNDIGTLFLNDNDTISFIPCEAGLLTPELYSLSSFDMKKLADMPSQNTIASKTLVLPHQAVETVNIDTTPMSTIPTGNANDAVEEFLSDGKTIGIKISVLRNVAAIFIALAFFLAMSSPISNSNKALQMSQLDYGLVSRLINNIGNETKKTEALIGKPCETHNTTKLSEISDIDKKVETMDTSAEENYFCIVLASHVTKKNAKAFVDHLALKGFGEARVLTEKKKSIKVIYGRYSTDNEAYNALNNLVGNEEFYDAWVYKVKN